MNQASGSEQELVVRARTEPSEAVIRLVLARPDGSDLPAWLPGSHVEIVHREHIRQYSLTGDPARRDVWELAIQREAGSRGGSLWAHQALFEGARVRVRGPRNHFELVPAQEYLLIAGGIGITPLYPMALMVARAGARWRLVYGGRRRSTMAFLDELAALAADYPERGSVEVRPHDETGPLPLADIISEPRAGVAIYACGPTALLDAVEDTAHAWPPESLHVERYTPRQPQGAQP